MKELLLSTATLFLSASIAFADAPCNPHPFRPDGRTSCLALEAGGIKAAIDDQFSQDSAKIHAARKRYCALFPDRPGIQQAERDFFRALRQKDAYYMAAATNLTVNMTFVKMPNALAALAGDPSVRNMNDVNKVSNNLDGGIRRYAFPLFAQWLEALRHAEDNKPPSGNAVLDNSQKLMQTVAKLLNNPSANPILMVDALQDESNRRKAYENARNWAEFLASGLDISKYVSAKLYILSQMEADVMWVRGQDKSTDMPNPNATTQDFYDLLVKMFGEKDVLAAATATLHAPKNSVGGLATRTPVEIGEFVMSPSPNPYFLFLTDLTRSSPRAYAIALAFDPNVHLTTGPSAAYNTKANWEKAYSTYTLLVAKYGEARVLDAAKRLKETPKDSEGRIAGDPRGPALRYWFQALLKDPNAVVPDGRVPHLLASSYDSRWLGKSVIVRGTVTRVDLDTNGSPHYAILRFKDTRPDGFVGFSPYPDMLQSSYGNNFAGLIGKAVELQGDIQSFGQSGGVRILSLRQLKVLDAADASADFRESKLPDGATAPATVASPEYLAWKKFPPGTKVVLETRLMSEIQPDTNQYRRTPISRITMQLDSIDGNQAIVTTTSTLWEMNGQTRQTSPGKLTYPARKSPQPPPDATWTVTTGEGTLVINGKKIATKWEMMTRANDPMTFIKTWRSEDVPGGLVLQHEQEHTTITGKVYRRIKQTIYAPIDGVTPILGDATPPAPAAQQPRYPQQRLPARR